MENSSKVVGGFGIELKPSNCARIVEPRVRCKICGWEGWAYELGDKGCPNHPHTDCIELLGYY